MTAAPGRSGRRRWPSAEILLALGSLLLCFACLEVALRIHYRWHGTGSLEDLSREAPADGTAVSLGDILVPSADPRIVYRMRPHLNVQLDGVNVRTNAGGWRDRETPDVAPPGTRRVLVLGDSIAFGWRVEVAERFSDRLVRQLDEAGSESRWEGLTLAVPGYNLRMETEVFRQFGLRTHPDLLIYAYVDNDFCLPNFVVPRRDVLAPVSFTWLYLTRSSLLERRLVSRGDLMEPEGGHGFIEGDFCDPAEVPEQYRDLVGWEAFGRAADELAALTAEAGIPWVFLNLGRRRRVLELDLVPDGVPYLDLFEARERALEASGEERYETSGLVLGNGDKHPSARGHALIAAELLRFLRQGGLL